MSEFSVYLKLGLQHIADINAYDHILFIIALCATFLVSEWKKVLILVSGGVDSTVCSALLANSIAPSNLFAIHIDNGLMLGVNQNKSEFHQ